MGLKTKGIGMFSGLLVLMFILVASASAQPPICSNLTITPAEIELGDNVTISFDIENSRSISLTHLVNIRIARAQAYNLTLIPVELGAYESKTVSHTITPDTIGDYKVTVNTIKGHFTVKHPEIPPIPLPPFLSNLTITPAEIERGDDVIISLDIMNPNNQTFAYIVTMKIGELTLQVDSDMGVYESKTLSRTITPGAVGVYIVTVDGMTGNFTVNPKPSFWDKIPGFPYESTILGLVTGIFVLWLLSRRKMTL